MSMPHGDRSVTVPDGAELFERLRDRARTQAMIAHTLAVGTGAHDPRTMVAAEMHASVGRSLAAAAALYRPGPA